MDGLAIPRLCVSDPPDSMSGASQSQHELDEAVDFSDEDNSSFPAFLTSASNESEDDCQFDAEQCYYLVGSSNYLYFPNIALFALKSSSTAS